MKLLIAIILMVLTGVCFADVGDYRLNGEDNARIESVVTDNCEKTAVLVGGDRLARVGIEYSDIVQAGGFGDYLRQI